MGARTLDYPLGNWLGVKVGLCVRFCVGLSVGLRVEMWFELRVAFGMWVVCRGLSVRTKTLDNQPQK